MFSGKRSEGFRHFVPGKVNRLYCASSMTTSTTTTEEDNNNNSTNNNRSSLVALKKKRFVKRFRALSPLSQFVSLLLLSFYVLDTVSDSFNAQFGLQLSITGILLKPWTLITSQFICPSVFVLLPMISAIAFAIEILLKRAFVGARVVCELLFVASAVCGVLYFSFDFTRRALFAEQLEEEPLALGPHGVLGGLFVLCQKLKNELSDEEKLRRLARYAPTWYLVVAVFLGGEMNREERVFGCALFGVVGGNVYFRWRGREMLGMNHHHKNMPSLSSLPGRDAPGSESEEVVDEELKKKKLREELGKKALMERMKQKEAEKEKTSSK